MTSTLFIPTINSSRYYVLIPNPRSNHVAYTYFEICFQAGIGFDRHEPMFHLYRETEEYKACREKFERSSWVPFIEKIKGHHEGMSHTFAQSSDGESVHLGQLKLTITKSIIAEATDLPSTGEKYFKGIITDKNLSQKF